MSGIYLVSINNQPKGEIYKSRNRWRWRRGKIAIESYSRLTRLEDVQDHIARLCRVMRDQVKLTHLPARYITEAESK